MNKTVKAFGVINSKNELLHIELNLKMKGLIFLIGGEEVVEGKFTFSLPKKKRKAAKGKE